MRTHTDSFRLCGPALLVLLAAGAGGFSMLSADPDEPWTTVDVTGWVTSRTAYEPQDHWTKVRAGDELSPRSAVRIGRRGRAILMRSGDLIRIGPESELELPRIEDESGVPEILQDSGTVAYEFGGGPRRRWEVVTPFVVASVEQAAFSVSIAGGSASVDVASGVVEVISRMNGDHLFLHPGETLSVTAANHERLVVRRIEAVAAAGSTRSDR